LTTPILVRAFPQAQTSAKAVAKIANVFTAIAVVDTPDVLNEPNHLHSSRGPGCMMLKDHEGAYSPGYRK
jgi:hypothetical protein